MAPAPRLTLIWLTGLVIAIVVNAVNGGYVDKNGKPAPKPCIEGKEYFNSLFVYECKQRKFVLSGCKMNNNQYKMNEIRDFNNLRMQFCVKTGRTIRSGVTGCVTDDGLFLNSSATVTQKNGVQFTCIQEKNTFRFKKLKVNVPKVVTITKKQCKLNEEKILGDRYLVKCRKTETGARKFELHQCLADIGQRETAFPVNESYHHYMDKEKTWGFVFKCETYENKFSFRPVACLLKSVEIAEGQTHKDGRRSVMCYRDASNKLKLRSAFESEVKTKTCKKTKTYNRGNLRIKCVSGKLPEAISCVSNNGTHLIAIGETYKIVGAFKYVCENASNGLVFKKVACLDLKGREINENNVANAPDGSQIRCVRNNSTGDLDRIFISGQNIPCKPGSEPIVLNNLQYVCNSKTHYYNAEACVSFAKDPQIIPLGKSYDTKWYRYLCERKNNDIVFHAVNCFDDVKNEIAPGQENKSGKMLYKCTIKNEFDLSLVIAEAGGCTNPVNQKHLSSGSVMRKSRFIGQLNYKIAFKCVKDQSAEASYKWEANGILIGDKNYPANATSFEIEGQEYKIVQIGGNDIRVVEAQDYETNCYVHKNTYKNNETWISQNGESVFQCVKGHAVKINCRLQKEELFVLQLEQVTYIGKVPYYCSDDELVELPFDGCIFKKNEYKWNDEFPIEHTVFKCVLSQQNGMYVSAVQAVGCVHNGKKLAINDYVMESGKYLVCNEIVGLTEMKIATAEEVACIIKTQTIDCSGSGAQVDASAGSGEARAIADPLGQGVDAADYHFNDTDVLITTDDDDDIYVTLYPPTNGRIQTGCVNGTKVNNGHVIYVCYQNKMVYYGCFVNGREHREGEIVDRKNLRSKFCVKKGNRIISSVIGCLTDDGIFLESHQNVTQSDSIVFTCQPRYINGVRNGYTFVKWIPPKLTSTCHLGEQKVLRNMYVLECRHSETTIGGFEYTLKGCLTQAGDLSTLIKPNQTHDDFFDDSDFGFRYACVIRKRQLDMPVIYTYEAVACLSGKTTIQPGQTYNSGSLTVMCYQEGRFLRLKPVYVGLSTEICTDNSVFYLGNFKYECKKGKQKRAVACLSFKNNTEVKIDEYFDEPFTYRYQCQLYTYKNSLSFTKTHCLDDNNQPMEPGTRKVLNDDSAILCRYDQNTDELARISISGRLHKCQLGDDSVFVKNYIAYKCVKHAALENESEGQYKPIGCAPENDKSTLIQFGEYHSSQFYRYICEKKGEFSAVYRAVVCLDGHGLVIKPQHRERTGDFVYKCVRKASGSLELKIYNPRGCLNPFKNHTLLKPGSVIKETGNIHGVEYEKRFKCVRAGIYFELIAEGIFFKGSRYERPGQVVFEKNGGKLIIVQTHSGGYDVEFKRNDQLRCYYNQKVYENGAHFIAPSGDSIYHCNNGEMTKIACKIGKYKLHVGQTTEIDKQIYQCPYISEGYIKIPISGCHLKNGTDIPFGMSFIDKSVVYRCSYQGGGSDYKAVIIAVGCIMNDHVIPINGYREIIRGRKQFFICRFGYEEGPSVIESNEMETDCITARGKVDCNDVNEYGYYSLAKTMFGSSSGSYVIQGGGEEVDCGGEWSVIDFIGEPDFGHITYSPDGGTGTDVYFTIPSDTTGATEPGTSKLVTVPSISTNGFTITNLTATFSDGTTNGKTTELTSTSSSSSSSTSETEITDEFTSSSTSSSSSSSSSTASTGSTIQPSSSTKSQSSSTGGSSFLTTTGVTGSTHVPQSTSETSTGFTSSTGFSSSSSSPSSTLETEVTSEGTTEKTASTDSHTGTPDKFTVHSTTVRDETTVTPSSTSKDTSYRTSMSTGATETIPGSSRSTTTSNTEETYSTEPTTFGSSSSSVTQSVTSQSSTFGSTSSTATSNGPRSSTGIETTDHLSTSRSVTPGVSSESTVTTSEGTTSSRVTEIDLSTSESTTPGVSSGSTFTTSEGTRHSRGTETTENLSTSTGYDSSRVPTTGEISDSTTISIGLSSTTSKGTSTLPGQTESTGASSGSTSSIKISTDAVVTTGTSETASTTESESYSSSSGSFSTLSSLSSSSVTETVPQSTSEQKITTETADTSQSTGSTSVGTSGIPSSRATRISTETSIGSSLPSFGTTVTESTDGLSTVITTSRGIDSTSSQSTSTSTTGQSTGVTHSIGSTSETQTPTQGTSSTGISTDITYGAGSTLVDTAPMSNTERSTTVLTSTNEQSSSTSSVETHPTGSTKAWLSTGAATGATASVETDSTVGTSSSIKSSTGGSSFATETVTGVTGSTHVSEVTESSRSTSETSTGFSVFTSKSTGFSSSSSSSLSSTSDTKVTKVTDEGTTEGAGSTTIHTETPDKFTIEPTTVCNETATTPPATDATEYPSTPSSSSTRTGYSRTVTSTGRLSTVAPAATTTPEGTSSRITEASTLPTETSPSSSSSPGTTQTESTTREGTTVLPGSTFKSTDESGATSEILASSTTSESSWSTESASSISTSTREESSSVTATSSYGSTSETGQTTATNGITKTPTTGFTTSHVSSSESSGSTSGTEIYTIGKTTTDKTSIGSSSASESTTGKIETSKVFTESSYGTTSETGGTTIESSTASESPSTKVSASMEPSHGTRSKTGTSSVTKVPSTSFFISRSSSFEISDGTSHTKINPTSADKTLAASSISPESSWKTESPSSSGTNTRSEPSSVSTLSYRSTSETGRTTATSDVTTTLPTEFFSSSSSSFGSSAGTGTTKLYTIGTSETIESSSSSVGTPSDGYSTLTTEGKTPSPEVTQSRSTESTTVLGSSTTEEASSSTYVTGRSSSTSGNSHSTGESTFETDTSTGTTTTHIGDGTTITGISPSDTSSTATSTFKTTKPLTTSDSISSTSETPTTVTEEYLTSLSSIHGGGLITARPLPATKSSCIDLIPKQVCLKFLPICAPHALKRNIVHSVKQDRVQLIDYDLERVDKLQTSQQFKDFVKEMEQQGVINSLNSLHFQENADLIVAPPKSAVKNQQCDELQDSCQHNNQESCLAHDDYCFKGVSGVCRTEPSCQKSVNNHQRETAEFLTRLCPVTCGLQTCFVEGSKAYDIDEIDGFVDALRTCQ